MTDLALAWSQDTQRADWTVAAGDLATDAGLNTAVLLSLGTDRRAAPDDALPPNIDPRGHWGDIPAESAAKPDLLGSRFWLRRRALLTTGLLRQLEADAREALQWLVDNQVAASVTATARLQDPPLGTVLLDIAIIRRTNGTAAAPRFATTWAVTIQ